MAGAGAAPDRAPVLAGVVPPSARGAAWNNSEDERGQPATSRGQCL